MASGITLKMQLDPMLVDYLKSIFYADQQTHQVAVHHSQLGALIEELLTKPPIGFKPRKYDGADYVEFIIPASERKYFLSNSYLSKNSEDILRTWIKNKFRYELRDHIEDCTHGEFMEIKQAIINFCDMHQIHPDHYKVNSLYKDYYRWNEKKKMVKKRKKISSSFAPFLSVFYPFGVLCVLGLF